MPDGNHVSGYDQARAGGRDYAERCDQRRYGMYQTGSNNIQLGAGARLVNVLRPCPDCREKLLLDGERACPHCLHRRSQDEFVGFVGLVAAGWVGCIGIVSALADLVGANPEPGFVLRAGTGLELVVGAVVAAMWLRRFM